MTAGYTGDNDARDPNPFNLLNPVDACGMSNDAWIRAGQEGVHVADAAYDAGMGELVGASKTERYVEFNAPSNMIETTTWNNNYGIPTYRIHTVTDYDVSGSNPSFGPWWKFW